VHLNFPPHRCAECEDEHLDVLLDRPLSYAPYDKTKRDMPENTTITNRHAPLVSRASSELGLGCCAFVQDSGARSLLVACA